MKKFSLITTLIAPLILLSGCEKEKVTDEADAVKIQFSAEDTSSRAAIGSEGFLTDSAFSVWGYMTKESQTATVFYGSTVTKEADDNWNCNDIRYWFPGWTYNFYGVYPAGLPENSFTVTSDGNISVTNFDCSATGADAVDLMTATAQRTTKNPMDSEDVKTIPLIFNHELAKVNFTVKSENTVATVSSFKVYGVNYKGTLTKGQTATWNPVTACGENDTPYKLENFTFNTTNGFEKDMLGDVLLIPDTDLTDAKLYIAYRYPEETTDRTPIIDLKTTDITQWEAGKSYHYTLTIKGGNLTITVNVEDWTEKNTSVSWG